MHVIVSVLAVLAITAPITQGQVRGNELIEPPVIIFDENAGVINLVANYKQISVIDGRNNNVTIANFTTRVYCKDGLNDCPLPAHTFVMWPDIPAQIWLCNNMTGQGAEILNDTEVVAHGYTPYKDMDVINLHTHGLHVNPGEDNVVTRWQNPFCPTGWTNATNNGSGCVEDDSHTNFTAGANCQMYNFTLPSYHYPGTHWWHTHQHGSVTLQVAGGMYGGIAVLDGTPANGSIYDDPADWGMAWIFVAFQYLVRQSDCSCPTWQWEWMAPIGLRGGAPWRKRHGFPVPSRCTLYCFYNPSNRAATGMDYTVQLNPSYYNMPDTTILPTGNPSTRNGTYFYLVNGQYQPTKTIEQNKWYRWKLVNVALTYLFLKLDDTNNCEFWLIGNDGIDFEGGPRDLTQPPYFGTAVMTIGNRADFAMKCTNPGRVGLWALYTKWENISDHSANFSQENSDALNEINKVASDCLVNTGGSATFDIPTCPVDIMIMDFDIIAAPNNTATATPVKNIKPYSTCMYLKDTLNLAAAEYTTDTSEPLLRGSTVLETPNLVLPSKPFQRNGTDVWTNKWYHAVGMNNVSYSEHDPLFTFTTNVTHEWTVFIRFHPFHHHTWPFQVQSAYPNLVGSPAAPSTGWWVRKGDWRDVVGLYGSLVVRVNYVAGGPEMYTFLEGKLVTHCHFVFHEDFGMMAWYQMSTNTQQPLSFTAKNSTFTLSNSPNTATNLGGTSQTCQTSPNPEQVYITGKSTVESRVLGTTFGIEFAQIGNPAFPDSPQGCFGVIFTGTSRKNADNFFVRYSLLTDDTCGSSVGIGLRLQAFKDKSASDAQSFQAIPVLVNPPYMEATQSQLDILNLMCNTPELTNNADTSFDYRILCYFGVNGNSTEANAFRLILANIFGSVFRTGGAIKFSWTYGEGWGSSRFPLYTNENVAACPFVLTPIAFNQTTQMQLPLGQSAVNYTCVYGYFNLISQTPGTYISTIGDQLQHFTGAPTPSPTDMPTTGPVPPRVIVQETTSGNANNNVSDGGVAGIAIAMFVVGMLAGALVVHFCIVQNMFCYAHIRAEAESANL